MHETVIFKVKNELEFLHMINQCSENCPAINQKKVKRSNGGRPGIKMIIINKFIYYIKKIKFNGPNQSIYPNPTMNKPLPVFLSNSFYFKFQLFATSCLLTYTDI